MVGKIYSMTNYFVVKEVNGTNIVLTNQNGQDMKSNLNTVHNAMQSADEYSKEEKLNQTELINIILNNPRTAMSIYFQKQDTSKTKKVFDAEKSTKIAEIQNAKVGDIPKLLSDLIDNPILNYIPGDMRLIKGYYTGSQDERGRLNFVDMEDPKKLVKGVDPRTVSYVIVNNVKYSIK